ncbi:MAG: hypothetical protein LIP02_09955 [Bacteroidales bacterium]|nr:hypothetical protein [Bacteroidales bacterium]
MEKLKWILLMFVAAVTFGGCAGRHTPAWERLDTAQALLEEHPDSALAIIEAIDPTKLGGAEERGRYSLLHAMAIDKCGIDTTDASLIAPALSRYRHHGTADDRLKALYYAGRIASNADSLDAAMRQFVAASAYIPQATDTLAIGRLLIAQAVIKFSLYDYRSALEKSLAAAQLYDQCNAFNYAFDSYEKALGYAMMLDLNDSLPPILYRLGQLAPLSTNGIREFQALRLNVAIHTQDTTAVQEILGNLSCEEIDYSLAVEMLRGFLMLEDYEQAEYIFQLLQEPDGMVNRIKYWAVAVRLAENQQDYKRALDYFAVYDSLRETHDQLRLTQELQFSEERHLNELQVTQLKERNRFNTGIGICISLLILCGLIIALLRLRSVKMQKLLAEKSLEEARMKAELDASQLDNARLEASNLNMRLSSMEAELEILQSAQASQLVQADEVNKLLRNRIDLINFLLHQPNLNPGDSRKSMQNTLEAIIKEDQAFIENTRKAYENAYPRFYSYLKEHDLTPKEISYACLYLMGIRGFEIGELTGDSRHYHVNSSIRKKLGLGSRDSNLDKALQKIFYGLYPRR